MTIKNEHISPEAIEILTTPFEKKDIKKRDGGFGRQLDYVEGYRVIQVLNKAFNHNWTFHIQTKELIGDCIIVQAQIEANGIKKESVGSKKAMKRRNSTEFLDIGNDFKAATTDALKKCATLLGVALDLYGADTEATPAATRAEPEEDLNKPVDPNQVKAINKITELKKADLGKILKKQKVTQVEELTFISAKTVITELNAL